MYRFAIALLACLLVAPAAALAQDSEHTLSVIGVGQTDVRPDQGSFDVRVVQSAPTARAARTRANRRFSAVVRAVSAVGVPEAGITTVGIEVARVGRRASRRAPVHYFFRASRGMQVRVSGLGLLAKAIDAATDHGATNVYGPELSLSDTLAATTKATTEAGALADARARADKAAAALGQTITGVQSADLDPLSDDGYYYADAAASAGGSADTAIFGGFERYSSRARVTYLIAPA